MRAALKTKDGDAFTRDDAGRLAAEVRKIPGVAQASVAPITVDGSGRFRIFVGIREEGVAGPQWREAPTGDVRLTDALRKINDDAMAANGPAVRRGGAYEDNSQGHSLSKDAELRKPQEAAVEALKTQAPLVRDVLLTSGSPEDRRAAAWLLGYAPDKKAVVADLVTASRDPEGGVRNNAARALGAIAVYAEKNPALGISIPHEVYLGMLNSIVWTDLNKASFVLMELTKKHDPRLLRELREQALPTLSEMARWKSDGHAYPAIRILGHLAGWKESAVQLAVKDGKIEELIAAASAVK